MKHHSVTNESNICTLFPNAGMFSRMASSHNLLMVFNSLKQTSLCALRIIWKIREPQVKDKMRPSLFYQDAANPESENHLIRTIRDK